MGRLGLALLLALSCHVVLLLLILPGKNTYEPLLRGKDQVVVSIDRQVSFPVEQTYEMEPEKKVETEAESIPEPEEIREKAVESESEEVIPAAQKPLTNLQPAARRKKTLMNASKVEPAVPVARQQQRTEKEAFVQPVRIPEKGPGKKAVEKETIGEAVPLTEKNIPPDYPGLARRRGWEGTVMLAVDVASDGQVGSVRVHTGSSYSLLDNAALDAVKKWQFVPGTKNGLPVAMTVLVPVHFILQEQ